MEQFIKTFPYSVSVINDKKNYALEWGHYNIKQSWTNNWVDSDYITPIECYDYKFFFSSKEDALVFKLKWGGN
jgi:hypothetical protein